jgi:hypothetical protein
MLPKVALFYLLWYPKQWIPADRAPREYGELRTHVRYAGRTSRRLARKLFHKMVRYGAGLQRKQMLLFRAVDVGAELFAIAATTGRAQMMVRTGHPQAKQAVALTDLFCRQARRRVDDLFRALDSNDDGRIYETARSVLDGEHLWMEEGIVGLQEGLSMPDFDGIGDRLAGAAAPALRGTEEVAT